jgi:hypothetical protein
MKVEKTSKPVFEMNGTLSLLLAGLGLLAAFYVFTLVVTTLLGLVPN